MIAPALPRWVSACLSDPATGVNAVSSLVPRAVSDPEPPAVAIYNALDEAWVARKHVDGEATADEWVLAVRVAQEMRLAGDPGQGGLEDDATLIVELHGVTEDQANNAVTLGTAYRVMRAVRRVLHQQFLALQMAPLILEGQQIALPASLNGFTLDSTPGSGQITIALELPFTITDTWALGAEET